MRIALQVPIKAASERVPGKNFKPIAGKPLAFWLLDRLAHAAPPEWDVVVDSEAQAVIDRVRERYGEAFMYRLRPEWLAGPRANGNHLINTFANAYPGYDAYGQAFVTAPTLPAETILDAVAEFERQQSTFDSLTLVTRETRWVWLGGQPLNYDHLTPNGLPRSQDAEILQETTGFYLADPHVALLRCCRLGLHPLLYEIPRKFALDIDTQEDFDIAERALLDDQE